MIMLALAAGVFFGFGFANISMSLEFNRARFDASPLLLIAVIIFYRTDLTLAVHFRRGQRLR
jgi:hypothetical protein